MNAMILSPEALKAMEELLAGAVCIPTEEVVRELGHAGLAYRRDLRSRSRRLSLTREGVKFNKSNTQAQTPPT